MKVQDELFQLIRSLSPSEKRYFKVNSDSKSNYLQLFEAIDSQKDDYDEALLKKKYAKKPFVKYLSAEKKQLREQIMKQMRAYHSDAKIDNKINELLQDEAFYRDKGLKSPREKAIAKAKELATKYERFYLLREVLMRNIQFVLEFEKKNLTEPIINLINEQKQLTIVQETALELDSKNKEIFSFYRIGADMANPVISNRVEMLISEIERYRPRLSNYYTLNAWFERGYSNYYMLNRDWKMSLECTQREYDLFQKFDHFKIQDAMNYKICLANLVSRALSARDKEWFMKGLNEQKATPVQSFNEEGEVFQNVYFQEHLFHINNGEFEKAEELVPTIVKGLKKYAAKINKARLLSFQYNIFVMYFLMHRFKEALQWAEKLLEDKSEIKQSWKNATILLLPIVHFELEHVDLVENYRRSAYRTLKSKKRIHDFEKLTLKFLQEMPLNKHDKNFRPILKKLKSEIENIIKNPATKEIAGMEELKLWAESHLRNAPMTTLLSY